MKPEDSPYFGPVKEFPAAIGDADRARLTSEYRAAITDEIYPALTRLRDFLKNEYLAQARDGVGLMYMKGGDKLYAYLVQSTTTLPMTPDEIHELGLSEVARITEGMEKVRKEVGFKGNAASSSSTICATSPKFKPKSREALTQGFYEIGKTGRRQVPRYFSTDAQDAARDPALSDRSARSSRPAAPTSQGTPDGSRPGTFYFNAYDLPSRTHPGHDHLVPPRRRAGAPLPDQPGAGE